METYYATEKIDGDFLSKKKKSVFFIDKELGPGKWVNKRPKIGTHVFIYTGKPYSSGLQRIPLAPWGTEEILRSVADGFPDTQTVWKGLPKKTRVGPDVQNYMEDIAQQTSYILGLIEDKDQWDANQDELGDPESRKQLDKLRSWFAKAVTLLEKATRRKIQPKKVEKKLDYFASIKNAWDSFIKIIEDEERWDALEDYLEDSEVDALYDAYTKIEKADDWIEKNPAFFKGVGKSLAKQNRIFNEALKKVNEIRQSSSKIKIRDKIEKVGDYVLEWKHTMEGNGTMTVSVYGRGTSTKQGIKNIKKSKYAPAIFSLTPVASGPYHPKDSPEKVRELTEKLWGKDVDPKGIWVITLVINKPGKDTVWIKKGQEEDLKLAYEAFNIITEIQEAEDPDNPKRGRTKGKLKSLYDRLEKINEKL